MTCDLACLTIKRVQTAAVRYPELPRPVFTGEFYVVSTDACGVRWIMSISGGVTGSGIKRVESSRRCQS